MSKNVRDDDHFLQLTTIDKDKEIETVDTKRMKNDETMIAEETEQMVRFLRMVEQRMID